MSVNYQEYLASREWGLKKRQVRERSDGYCERCLVAQMQAVHHKTYERLGNEDMADLMAVCEPCHSFLNGYNDYDPIAERNALIESMLAGQDASIRQAFLRGLAFGVKQVHERQAKGRGLLMTTEDETHLLKGRGAF